MSNENTKQQSSDVIDLRVVFKKITQRKKLFFIVLPIVFVVSCLLIICVPRYYISETKLVPEVDNGISNSGLGSLASIASTIGVDLPSLNKSDAISPMLYPDLMEDNGFVAKIFPIKVTNSGLKGEPVYTTTYFDYLKTKQKYPWWSKIFSWAKKQFEDKDSITTTKKVNGFDPYHMTKKEDNIANKLRNNISISLDKKTGVISINVKAQDPVICKTMTDSLKEMLQTYIIDYRTSKSKTDLRHYQQLEAEAKKEYEEARLKYSQFSDANMDITTPSFIVTRDDLENNMQLKYNQYQAMQAQVQIAHAKVQAQTPAFTMLKGADVPVKPAGPKRMLFVLGMLFLATFIVSLYIIKDELL